MMKGSQIWSMKTEGLIHEESVPAIETGEKCEDELISTKIELAIQNDVNEKVVAELDSANKELHSSNEEKGKREAELIIANKELVFQNREKQNREAELIVANKELVFQNEENEKQTIELNITYDELRQTDDYLKKYIEGMEEMMFMTSHKVRQSIAHILGISSLLEKAMNSPDELKKMIGYIKQSTLKQDDFIKELTVFMGELERKGKNKNAS